MNVQKFVRPEIEQREGTIYECGTPFVLGYSNEVVSYGQVFAPYDDVDNKSLLVGLAHEAMGGVHAEKIIKLNSGKFSSRTQEGIKGAFERARVEMPGSISMLPGSNPDVQAQVSRISLSELDKNMVAFGLASSGVFDTRRREHGLPYRHLVGLEIDDDNKKTLLPVGDQEMGTVVVKFQGREFGDSYKNYWPVKTLNERSLAQLEQRADRITDVLRFIARLPSAKIAQDR